VPKGKKFNAAEKHFEKKCVELRKRIKELEETNKLLHKRISDNCDEIEKLQMKNECLEQQNQVLMELKDMYDASKESVNKLSGLFDAMSKRIF